MANVDIDLPNKAKGAKVSIPGLGVFPNGEVSQVDDRRWKRFVNSSPSRAHLADEGGLVLRGADGNSSAPDSSDGSGEGAAPSVPPPGASSASEAQNKQALSYGSGNESSDEVLDANDESKEE